MSNKRYHPIDDAPFVHRQPIPMSFVSRGLEEIENSKGKDCKDVQKEIMSNMFRSASVLTPSEVPYLFYFLTVRLGPAYLAKETGIGNE